MQWRWGIYYGKLWMFQWALNGSMSLGIHVDPLYRIGDFGPYGPYVDLHIGPVVASFGYPPARGGHLRYLTNGAIMRPERTNTVARGVTRPSPCTTRAWRIARS